MNFEISNAHGTVYSSKTDGTPSPGEREIADLSGRIMAGQKFEHMHLQNGASLFGIPFRNGDAVIGSLIAYDTPSQPALSGRSDIKETERFLVDLSNLMNDRWTFQKETKEMAEEIEQSFEELYLYSKISTQVKTLKFTGSMQKDLIEDILGIMRVDFAFAELPDYPEYNVMAFKRDFSEKVPDSGEFIDRLLSSLPRDHLLSEDHYIIVNDSREDERFRILHPDPYRFLAVKMQHKNELYGWLGMVSFNMKEIFRRSELSLLVTMAEQIAVVIANTDLYRDLERFVINVVKSLVYVIEAKDVYTRGHSERVNHYCMRMAERLNMAKEGKKDLHWASILHDIGKIGIPEAILNKPDRLSDWEFDNIRKHPAKGVEILEPIEQLRSSLDGILHHHERYDGKGYPDGLKGEKIPLIGRIIAVADTFDAITSNRAYRDAKTPAEAMAIMEQVSGSQLDSKLVNLFKEMLEGGLFADVEGNHETE